MTDHPLIGRTLHSNYRIERLLGCGGMACVYYAWDANLDRAAAVKVIDTVQQTNPAYARRIVQEAKSIAKWRHENIVQVYHAASEDGLYYFAMEYVEGRDLGDLLQYFADRRELIPHEDMLRIGWAVARALDYAHLNGVIHRDVKPANVMIAKDGRIVLTDFGLALDVAQGTRGEVFGSPHYIAPEQAVSSSNAVAQSDLYSLGIILYEMLTGRPPFDDHSPVSLAVKHISEPLPLPSSLNPEIGIATEAVLIKALSKEPQERYQTGAALMKALENSLFEGQEPISPEPTPARGVSRTSLADFMAAVERESKRPINEKRPYDVPPAASVRKTLPTPLPKKIVVPPKPESTAIVPAPESTPVPIKVGKPKKDVNRLGRIFLISAILFVLAGFLAIVYFFGDTPEQSGSVSETATATPEPTITPTPTEVPMMPYPVLLYYNESGFYLWNHGDREVTIAPISFEAIGADYAFSGDQWANLNRIVESGKCNGLLIENADTSLRPSNCVQFSASRTRQASTPLVFWLPREGVTYFRVLWNDDEIATCEIARRQCEIEVFVPAE